MTDIFLYLILKFLIVFIKFIITTKTLKRTDNFYVFYLNIIIYKMTDLFLPWPH